MSDEYYVYQLRVENSLLPFYIGKGNNGRAYYHLSDVCLNNPKENKHKKNTIKKAFAEGKEVLVEFIWENLSENEALRREVWAIHIIGRKDKKMGPLTNKTDGGDGISGWVATQEQNMLNSKRQKSAWTSDRIDDWSKRMVGEGNPNYGKTRLIESRLKSSSAWTEGMKISARKRISGENNPNYGKPISNEAKQKISRSLIGIKQDQVMCPHCNKVGGINAMKRWHFNNCNTK